MQCFIQNVRLFNIFRGTVGLKRKSVVLLPVYTVVRTRTSSGSYRNRYGANDWSRHDKHLNSQTIFDWIFFLLTLLRGRQPKLNFFLAQKKKSLRRLCIYSNTTRNERCSLERKRGHFLLYLFNNLLLHEFGKKEERFKLNETQQWSMYIFNKMYVSFNRISSFCMLVPFSLVLIHLKTNHVIEWSTIMSILEFLALVCRRIVP